MKKRRHTASVNAGSMADIAFLLLIFFLVATQLANTRGIPVILPEYYDGPPGQAADNNVLRILINAQDELLIESKLSDKETVTDRIKDFVLNPTQLSSRPSTPQKAIISIESHAKSTYEAYLDIYSRIHQAYRDMRDEYALSRYGKKYAEISADRRKLVAQVIPLKVSEADPFHT